MTPATHSMPLTERIANAVILARAAGDQHHLGDILEAALHEINLLRVDVAGRDSSIGHLCTLVDELREQATRHQCPGALGTDPARCWHVRCQLGKACVHSPPQITPRSEAAPGSDMSKGDVQLGTDAYLGPFTD